MNFVTRWIEWLTSRERRQVKRSEQLPLVAYYWDGGTPMAHPVRNISDQGLYLLTEQRWYPGTLLMLSLQREDLPETDPGRTIAVNAKVVHSGDDGVGFSLVMPKAGAARQQNEFAAGADQKTYIRFLRGLRSGRGQALIEYALTLPIVFILIINLVNFGGFFFAWVSVANAARAAADYGVLGGASAGSLAPPTSSQLTTMISTDLTSLPNGSTATVNICQNSNGTVTTISGSCSGTAPTDPEAASYVLTWVDVNYTYTPFIPAGFSFPGLHVYVTLPPTTIHQRAVMREIQ